MSGRSILLTAITHLLALLLLDRIVTGGLTGILRFYAGLVGLGVAIGVHAYVMLLFLEARDRTASRQLPH